MPHGAQISSVKNGSCGNGASEKVGVAVRKAVFSTSSTVAARPFPGQPRIAHRGSAQGEQIRGLFIVEPEQVLTSGSGDCLVLLNPGQGFLPPEQAAAQG